MSTRTSPWPAGVPCWVDLTVPDLEAAKAFYRAVLGWDYQQFGEEYGGYAIATVRGQAVAGLGPQPADAPVTWTLYLASDDADATAHAVEQAGGTVLLAPGDVGSLGRMLLATDPTGAAFGVWQAGDHLGAAVVNEPGGLTWEDLRSSDPGTARAFYSSVFGYAYESLDMAPGDYQTFAPAPGEPPLGGMGGLMGGFGPSHWLVYFGVADTPAAAALAREHGGQVVAEPFATPYGHMAGLTDPAGALFWVVETRS